MFDDENTDDEEDNKCFGVTTVEQLRDHALQIFGQYIKEMSKNPELPEQVPESATRFLSIEETENILGEFGRDTGEGFLLGGATREEANETIEKMMSAIMSRILSNILAEGVNAGRLECYFDPEINDFAFDIAKKDDEHDRTNN